MTDQEKANTNMGIVTVSPPTNNDTTATGADDGAVFTSINNKEETEIIVNTHASKNNWTNAEDEEALAKHGISPNYLFGEERKESTGAKGTAPTEQGTKGTKTDKSKSPDKKRSKST